MYSYKKVEMDNPNNGYKVICNWLEHKDIFKITKQLEKKLINLKEQYESSNLNIDRYDFLKKLYYTIGLSTKNDIKTKHWTLWRFVIIEDNVIYFRVYLDE